MKIDTEAIREEYDSNSQMYEMIVKIVSFNLYQEIQKHLIKINHIHHRIKQLDSLIGKMRRHKVTNPFKEIHDIIGFRIICLFREDLEKVEKIVESLFDVFDRDDKIYEKESTVFGYMSIHLKAHLKKSAATTINVDPQKYPFEIQIRTIVQDAWASISHHLDYKKENSIPNELMKDFNALSGLFYIADTHFEFIKKEQSRLSFEEDQ